MILACFRSIMLGLVHIIMRIILQKNLGSSWSYYARNGNSYGQRNVGGPQKNNYTIVRRRQHNGIDFSHLIYP